MTFLCNGRLDYSGGKKLAELSDTDYARLSDGVKSKLRELLPEDRVRGHLRTLRNADGSLKKIVPVKSHHRGDDRLGIIKKDYKVN